MSVRILQDLFNSYWGQDPWCIAKSTVLDVGLDPRSDAYEVRLADYSVEPCRYAVIPLSCKELDAYWTNPIRLGNYCREKWEWLRSELERPAPVLSTVCPCGIHRADCDYHRQG